MRIAMTGGAGFIGSHLVEEMAEEHEVVVIDNLSSGSEENIPGHVDHVHHDITEKLPKGLFKEVDSVFHLAANPKVNTFPKDRHIDFNTNLKGTKHVLDECVDSNVDDFVFASSSVVYGEDTKIPTPEHHRLNPISMYGATKAGGEHKSRVYSDRFGMDLTILRLANIVGGRNQKGVIYDFVHKLKDNPEKLTILGNGKQRKSYLHVEDTVEGILHAWESENTVFNIGAENAIDVDGIAEIVAEELGLNPEYEYTGGDRGWEGDVPEMRLHIDKLKQEGWKPEKDSHDSVRRTVRELVDQ